MIAARLAGINADSPACGVACQGCFSALRATRTDGEILRRRGVRRTAAPVEPPSGTLDSLRMLL